MKLNDLENTVISEDASITMVSKDSITNNQGGPVSGYRNVTRYSIKLIIQTNKIALNY